MAEMLDKPLVTLITPVFNGATFLEKCYDSIVSQSYKNVEWVVVDDGSTDNTKDLIVSLQAKGTIKIKYIYQQNSGACKAREAAILAASGAYIANIDSDDYLSSNAICLAIEKIINNSEVDFALFDLHFIDLDGNNKQVFHYSTQNWPISGEKALSQCISEWKIHALGVVKKEVYLKAYQLLGHESGNNVNTDELLTRYIFHFCKMVDFSQGNYFYVNNTSSTTKSVNINAYKMIYNAIKLNDFISDRYPHLSNHSQNNLLSTAWSICHLLFKYYSKLGNKKQWVNSIYLANNHINFNEIKYDDDFKISSKIKFYIKIITVKLIGCFGTP